VRPVPFYMEKYCREKNITYRTSHQRPAEYIDSVNLNGYTGPHVSSDVIVLTDSGFDDKKIQKAVLKKNRHFICALKSSRGVKSEAEYAKDPESHDWDGVAVFFDKFRKLPWSAVRIFTDGPKKSGRSSA